MLPQAYLADHNPRTALRPFRRPRLRNAVRPIRPFFDEPIGMLFCPVQAVDGGSGTVQETSALDNVIRVSFYLEENYCCSF